jgi:RNA polymerase sigma-70 factor (ECF subfamily)
MRRAVIVSGMCRQILVDYATRRSAGKRGGAGARKVDIDEAVLISAETLEDAVAIDEGLERLAQIDPRQGRPVELRFFAGLSAGEAAEVMGVSEVTIKREWRWARAWLHREPQTRKSG